MAEDKNKSAKFVTFFFFSIAKIYVVSFDLVAETREENSVGIEDCWTIENRS